MAFWKRLPVREVPIGGFSGLHENLSATTRSLKIPSAISNLIMDPPGTLTTRPGITALGSAVSAAVTRGIHQYVNLAGTTVQTLVQAGTQLSYWSGSAWTSITASAPAKAFTAATLNDIACIFYKGSAAYQWNGTTLTTLAGSPPQGEFACAAYGKIFVGGITSREGDLDYCDAEDPTTWTPASTNHAGSTYISASPIKWVANDTRISKVMIWTTNELFQLDGPETGNNPLLWSPKAVGQYGTPNGRTVQRVGDTWIWLTNGRDKRGFAFWSGGETVVVEEPILTSLGLIDWSNIANACAWMDKRGRYNCSVPKSSGRAVFTFDPANRQWYVGTHKDVRASGIVRVSGDDIPIFGNEIGELFKIEGSDDAGTAITWSVTLGPSVLGEAWRSKQLTEMQLLASLAAAATLSGKVSPTETGSYGTTRTMTASTELTRTTVPLPVSTSDSQTGDAWRVHLSGSGVVDLHDLMLKVYAGGRK